MKDKTLKLTKGETSLLITAMDEFAEKLRRENNILSDKFNLTPLFLIRDKLLALYPDINLEMDLPNLKFETDEDCEVI